MDLGLKGKRAIVTGGSRGIGKAIARQLAEEGADVVITARTKDQVKKTAAELSAATGRRVLSAVVDTRDKSAVEALVAFTVAELGGVDILVNNAAVPGGISNARRNVGVAAITKNLGDELGPKGINVVAVHPGATRTERTDPASEATLAVSSSIGRIVDSSEVAWVVAFLASPKSVAINGDAISAGGGSLGTIHY